MLKMLLKTQLTKVFLLVLILPFVFYHQLNTLRQGTASKNFTKLNNYDYAKNDSENIAKVIKPEDTIFICGNPRMYLFTAHLPELSTNGWILEYYLDFQWEDFYSEFRAKPPTYLFVKNDYDTLIELKSKKLWELIINEYAEYEAVENGRWYKRI
jgi:hypothetical protein